MKKTALISLLMIFWTLSLLLAEDVSVGISQKLISLNDAFTVTFSTEQRLKEEPDFSPLEKNFDILSNGQEFNTTIINGVVAQQTRWKLVLVAKQEGSLEIPPIRFGQYNSPSKTIEVTKSSTVKPDDAIYLETEVSPSDSAYEQTALIYTVRLYTSVNLAQATLSELKTNDPDAIIQPLGKDAEYERFIHKGKHYRVIERKYSVIPQHAGELVFSPTIFEGGIMSGRNSLFEMQTQYKRIFSESHELDIKPIPAPFNRKNWLAAHDVKLTEEWSSDPSKMVVGEPITWTLKIAAEGTLPNLIPEVTFNFPDHLKHYLDKAEIASEETPKGIIGVKQIKAALIGTKSGEFEIPEISLKWWDLTSNEVKETILPKKTIHIQGADIAAISPPSLPEKTMGEGVQEDLQSNPPQTVQPLPLWVWGLVGLNGCLLAGGCFILYKKRPSKNVKPDSISRIKDLLKSACRTNDAKQAETYLIAWAAVIFPHIKPLNIMTIRQHVSEELRAALDELNRALYGNATSWNGDGLWESIQAFKPSRPKGKEGKMGMTLLKELYPRTPPKNPVA